MCDCVMLFTRQSNIYLVDVVLDKGHVIQFLLQKKKMQINSCAYFEYVVFKFQQ